MPGSFDWSPPPGTVAMAAIPIGVCLYDAELESAEEAYSLLPNVRCEQIQYKEGHELPSARFSYILDEIATANNGWPDQFEQIWGLGVAPSSYVVTNDDRLVVIASMPDGTLQVLFDGVARVPQVDVGPRSQHVTFVAVGVAVRCWDTPIAGRMQRDGDDPYQGGDIQIGLPTRFNPAGTGTLSLDGINANSTPSGYDHGGSMRDDPNENQDFPFPTFLDTNIDRSPDPLAFWNLSGAVRYLLGLYNSDEEFVDNPTFSVLDDLLQNRRPLPGAEWYDPDDPSTYVTDANLVRDFDCTNKAWPDAVNQLIGFYGFQMQWVTETDDTGLPYNYLEMYRKDQAGPTDPKQIYLPPNNTNIQIYGQNQQPMVNVGSFHAAFDYHSVANDILVETHPGRWEISVILAPGFIPNQGDEDAGNRVQFRSSNLESTNADAEQRRMYRYYIVDECADGYYSIADQQWVTETPFQFEPIFPNVNGQPTYVRRYRPGKSTVFSKDVLNKPRRAQLAISRDYGTNGGQDPPCFWDSQSGTWYPVTTDTWHLLNDRLGIMISADEPWAWNIGPQPAAGGGQGSPFSGGKVDAIKSLSNPDLVGNGASSQFWLRLTTVIEADFGIQTEATRRDASPISATIQRRVDASDHFHYDVIDGSSCYSTSPSAAGQQYVLAQDDSVNSYTHATQLRAAHEMPPLAGSVTIPYLSLSYQISDRISAINGRIISLIMNSGNEQQEAPTYPYVVALTWDFEGNKQLTTLQLSDRRLEPQIPRG